ncbi:acetate--CoA ligase family protein [Ahrensia sp. R2A130]|uniref:acetate--CoA ligase family protein n=1 Tax=Ahrensia sp. R2A130 TaxID=744979 RepID=UPI0001E09C60|nr:acetate--CoA ligase family protein [Ahrensia sp. R2A130]EFL88587.1 CoA-binding domain-containing protein [Ahrensia sp. R2A130]
MPDPSRLLRLIRPRTITVIGGKECERVVEQCDRLGFDGTIWPVHPTRETLGGRKCFRSIADLPEAPDAAYVAVNRERTISVVADLAMRGAGGAICYAAGFAEASAEDAASANLQTRLVEAAGDMPIVGPNCYGLINALDGAALWPDQHGAARVENGVAIITQSSNIAINMTMQKRGLPIAMVLTAGNQAQLGLSDLGAAIIEDERITALGLHIEGLDDVHAFERLALRARELGKPIVAIKVGRSEQAQAATITHTASLAGSDAAHDALFTRLGIARVDDIATFLETLKLLHVHGALPGGDVLSLSCSGGEASLMADTALPTGLDWRRFTEAETGALRTELGPMIGIANPLDYNTFIWGDWPAMIRMYEAALAPDFDLAMLVIDIPPADRCDPADWLGATNAFIAAMKQTGARAAVVSSLSETMPEELAQDLMAKGIAPLCGLDAAVRAADAARFIGEVWSRPLPLPLLQTSPTPSCHPRAGEDPLINETDDAFISASDNMSGTTSQPTPSGAPSEVGPRLRGDDNCDDEMLDEYRSKYELAAYGLIVPKGINLSADEAVNFGDLTQPFALKALGIAHKSEAGAVRLNLTTNAEVEAARNDMADLSSRFLLEEMAPKPLAELLVGITRDPTVGLMLTIGAGGVLTELLDDVANLLLPVTEADIRRALGGLKIGRLLDGYRDSDATDIDALIANIICIARYAEAHADTLEELDVNPLFATQYGSVAVDALIIKRRPQ